MDANRNDPELLIRDYNVCTVSLKMSGYAFEKYSPKQSGLSRYSMGEFQIFQIQFILSPTNIFLEQ